MKYKVTIKINKILSVQLLSVFLLCFFKKKTTFCKNEYINYSKTLMGLKLIFV